jgi:hypothetical protein
VLDDRDTWRGRQPSAAQEDRFIREYRFGQYELWHLGTDNTLQAHHGPRHIPCADFRSVHRWAILAAEDPAGQYEHTEIEGAAVHRHGNLPLSRSSGGPHQFRPENDVEALIG